MVILPVLAQVTDLQAKLEYHTLEVFGRIPANYAWDIQLLDRLNGSFEFFFLHQIGSFLDELLTKPLQSEDNRLFICHAPLQVSYRAQAYNCFPSLMFHLWRRYLPIIRQNSRLISRLRVALHFGGGSYDRLTNLWGPWFINLFGWILHDLDVLWALIFQLPLLEPSSAVWFRIGLAIFDTVLNNRLQLLVVESEVLKHLNLFWTAHILHQSLIELWGSNVWLDGRCRVSHHISVWG